MYAGVDWIRACADPDRQLIAGVIVSLYKYECTSENVRKVNSLTQWYVEKTTLTSMIPPSSYVCRTGYKEFSFPKRLEPSDLV